MWEILGEVFNKIVKEVINATAEYIKFEHEVKQGFREMGFNGQQLHNITKNILVDTQRWGTQYGMTKGEAMQLHKSLLSIQNTTGQLSKETKDSFAALSRLVGAGASTEAAKNMQQMGIHTKTAAAWIGKGVIQAKALGLNTQKFTEQLGQSIGLMHKMHFKTGITGLQKMIGLATRLGTSVEKLTAHIDIDNGAFSDIEKSIETAANLQRLGGSWAANFGNPMEVMAEGMFDAESAAERLAKTLEGKAVFNRATGQADMGWYNSKQLGIAAQALGMDPNEARSIAKRSAMNQAIEQDLGSKKGQFSSEELDAIKNLAEFDAKTGKFQINYTDKHGNVQTTDIENLTKEQLDEAIALSESEKNVDRNVANISRQVDKISQALSGSATGTVSAAERAQGTMSAYEAMKTDLLGVDGAVDKANNFVGEKGGSFMTGVSNFFAHPWDTIKSWFNDGGIVPKFAEGGYFESPTVVPGNSTQGDKVIARVNSGEMILTKDQQARLFKLLDAKSLVPKFAEGGVVGNPLVSGGLAYGLGTKSGRNFLLSQFNQFSQLAGVNTKLVQKTVSQVGTITKDLAKITLNPFQLFSNNNTTARLVRRTLRTHGGEEGVKLAEGIEKVAGKIDKFATAAKSTFTTAKGAVSNGFTATKNFIGNSYIGQEIKTVASDVGKIGKTIIEPLKPVGRLIAGEAKTVARHIGKVGKFIAEPIKATGRWIGTAGKAIGNTAKSLAKPAVTAVKNTVGKVAGKFIGKGVGKSIAKRIPGIGNAINVGMGLWEAGSAISDYSKMKNAIESRSDLSKKEKKQYLRQAQDDRNEKIGSAAGSVAGGAIGYALGGTLSAAITTMTGGLGATLAPWITTATGALGTFVGEKIGGFIGKNVNNVKDFLFGTKNELDDEDQAQLDYEETKMGQVDLEDPQLMEKAAQSTVAMHDLLISIWHKMNGKLSNGEEEGKKGLFANIASGIGAVAKGALSLATAPIRGVAGVAKSLFDKKKKGGKTEGSDLTDYQETMLELVSSINKNMKPSPLKNIGGNGLGLAYSLGMGGLFTAKNLIGKLFGKNENPEIEAVEDGNSAQITPEPLGSEDIKFRDNENTNTTTNNYNGTDTIKLEITGTLKLDAGSVSKEVDINKLLNDSAVQQKIYDFVLMRLNSSGGRDNRNAVRTSQSATPSQGR